MPELRQLRTFVAVAEELSFTRAAERLHLGQQAVSKAVGRLERELGVELLERTTREVRLTPAGLTLLEAGRETLSMADEAFRRAREIGRGVSGSVRVGVTPAIGPPEREQVVGVLRDGASELSITLVEARLSEARQLLHDRALDVFLVRAAGRIGGIDSAELRATPAVLCAPEGHPLAAADVVRLAELDGQRLMTWTPPGSPYTDLLLNRLAAAGAVVKPVMARVKASRWRSWRTPTPSRCCRQAGWPPVDRIAQVPLAEELTLPLVLLWRAGRPPWAVARLRAGMSPGARAPDRR